MKKMDKEVQFANHIIVILTYIIYCSTGSAFCQAFAWLIRCTLVSITTRCFIKYNLEMALNVRSDTNAKAV